MKAKLSGLSLGVSALALIVALWGSSSEITEALGGAPRASSSESTKSAEARAAVPSVQTELLRTTETISVRVDTLERQNTELRQALATTQSQLITVEAEYASSDAWLATVTDRIVQLEDSSADSNRRMLSFGRTLTATRLTLDKAIGEPQSETDAEDEEESAEEDVEEEPKLEDFLRIEMEWINGMPGPHIILEGANFHVRSGSGGTDDLGGLLYGLGNVIIGYNEQDASRVRVREGSHNLVVGAGHGYTSYGGLLAGFANESNAPGSSVSGGTQNVANGWASSISGGQGNLVSGDSSSVSGGLGNQATAKNASVTGGTSNVASGEFSTVAGGVDNQAKAVSASVTGGTGNIASGDSSTVTGGSNNQAIGISSAVLGGINILLDSESHSQMGTLDIPPF